MTKGDLVKIDGSNPDESGLWRIVYVRRKSVDVEPVEEWKGVVKRRKGFNETVPKQYLLETK